MTQASEEILTFLGTEYELFDESAGDAQILRRYRDARRESAGEGVWPLLIVPSDTLAETLELFCEFDGNGGSRAIARRREALSARARELDGQEFLRARYREYSQMHQGQDLQGAFLPAVRVQDTLVIPREPGGEVILATIRTPSPWELAIWVPMGGFNDCPAPEQQAAVFRHWHQRYGAVPALVTYDMWEMCVQHPVVSDSDCEALAREHFAFSYDNVMQSEAGSVRGLASGLRGASVWTFWWD